MHESRFFEEKWLQAKKERSKTVRTVRATGSIRKLSDESHFDRPRQRFFSLPIEPTNPKTSERLAASAGFFSSARDQPTVGGQGF